MRTYQVILRSSGLTGRIVVRLFSLVRTFALVTIDTRFERGYESR